MCNNIDFTDYVTIRTCFPKLTSATKSKNVQKHCPQEGCPFPSPLLNNSDSNENTKTIGLMSKNNVSSRLLPRIFKVENVKRCGGSGIDI